MTKTIYDAPRLEAMSLALIEMGVTLRGMARDSRRLQRHPLELHDRKAVEYLEKLEKWVADADEKLNQQLVMEEGATAAGRFHDQARGGQSRG